MRASTLQLLCKVVFYGDVSWCNTPPAGAANGHGRGGSGVSSTGLGAGLELGTAGAGDGQGAGQGDGMVFTKHARLLRDPLLLSTLLSGAPLNASLTAQAGALVCRAKARVRVAVYGGHGADVCVGVCVRQRQAAQPFFNSSPEEYDVVTLMFVRLLRAATGAFPRYVNHA